MAAMPTTGYTPRPNGVALPLPPRGCSGASHRDTTHARLARLEKAVDVLRQQLRTAGLFPKV